MIENPDNLSIGSWLTSVTFYNKKGRAVQTQADHYQGGTDLLTLGYDFSGKLLSSYLVHHNPAAGTNMGIQTNNAYDEAGRLVSITKNLFSNPDNATPTTTTLLLENEYDALGQLKSKKLAPTLNDGHGLENLVYDYNIRSWLTGLNKGYVTGTQQAWFGMELGYDKTDYTAKQYNGNIAGSTWRTKGDGQRRRYESY